MSRFLIVLRLLVIVACVLAGSAFVVNTQISQGKSLAEALAALAPGYGCAVAGVLVVILVFDGVVARAHVLLKREMSDYSSSRGMVALRMRATPSREGVSFPFFVSVVFDASGVGIFDSFSGDLLARSPWESIVGMRQRTVIDSSSARFTVLSIELEQGGGFSFWPVRQAPWGVRSVSPQKLNELLTSLHREHPQMVVNVLP